MKNLVIKSSLVFLVAALGLRPTCAAQTGAQLFAAKCAMCHGKDGDATTPMAKKLAIKPFSSADLQGQSDAELTTIIGKGRGRMPAYSGRFTADQTLSLVKYIRSVSARTVKVEDTDRGLVPIAPRSADSNKSHAPNAVHPLTLEEVVALLHGLVSPKRVASLVRERHVDFTLTEATIEQIRKAGGDDPLLLAIAASKM